MKKFVFVWGVLASALLLYGCSDDDDIANYEHARWDWSIDKRVVEFPAEGGTETLNLRGSSFSFIIADVYDLSTGEQVLLERTAGWPYSYDNGWLRLECPKGHPYRELSIKVDGQKHPEPYKILVLFGVPVPKGYFNGNIVIQSEGWKDK